MRPRALLICRSPGMWAPLAECLLACMKPWVAPQHSINPECLCRLVAPALQSWRQGDQDLEASLCYLLSLSSACIAKKKKKKN